MTKCAVVWCQTTDKRYKGKSVHRPPKNQVRKNAWLAVLNSQPSFELSKDVIVCSDHFTSADFQPQRDANKPYKKLFETAVPSINRPTPACCQR